MAGYVTHGPGARGITLAGQERSAGARADPLGANPAERSGKRSRLSPGPSPLGSVAIVLPATTHGVVMLRTATTAKATPDMPIKTKRWNDPIEPDDGFRLLVCRYRPRALPKAQETWDAWDKDLGPSRGLHADFYDKHGPPIDWAAYKHRYLAEMVARRARIAALAARVASGEIITLLCSGACVDAERCHRTLLKELVEKAVRG